MTQFFGDDTQIVLCEASSNNIESQDMCRFMLIAFEFVHKVSPSDRASRSHT